MNNENTCINEILIKNWLTDEYKKEHDLCTIVDSTEEKG